MPEYKVQYRELRYFTRTVTATEHSTAIDAVLADPDSTSPDFADDANTATLEAVHIYRVEDSE